MSSLTHVEVNVQSSLFLRPVTAQEISQIVINLKNTSSNINNIPIRILKRIKEIAALPLSKIINRSLERSVFPHSLIIAKVMPIFKSGDTQIASNYRPIAILPYLSKIFEKCVALQFIKFMNKFKVISDNLRISEEKVDG